MDPHLYKASEGDVRRLFRADIVFYGGLHLEARMGEVLEEMGAHHGDAVARTRAIPQDLLMAPPEYGAHDPHVWFDVRLWACTVDARDAGAGPRARRRVLGQRAALPAHAGGAGPYVRERRRRCRRSAAC